MAPLEVVLASDPPHTVRLAETVLGQGGQATVYVSEHDSSVAIKLYHRPTPEVGRRLQGMLKLARPQDFLTRDESAHPLLAWPEALVRSVGGRDVIGYAMPSVRRPGFVPLSVLFDPSQRRTSLPMVSWRFFVGVARNLSSLVAALHECDLVLGDLSPANFVVSPSGYLTLLDCDSIQFVAPDSGERFPCFMHTPEYAAPELPRNPRLEHTPESDAFSLAIVVCQLLLLGDHPFQGRRLDEPDDQDSGRSENIRGGYSYLVRPEEMGLPAGSYDPVILPPTVFQLARRAFGDGHTAPAARPRAADWLEQLDDTRLSLKVCAAEKLHVYGAHLSDCPWCERTAAGLPDPFRPRASRTPQVTSPVPKPAWIPTHLDVGARRVPALVLTVLIIALVVLAIVL